MMGQDGRHDDGVLLSRIAMLERRLQSLARLVVAGRGTRPGETDWPVHLCIDPDSQSELAAGFHHREHDAAGHPFRWAGKSDHFELRFHLDRFAARPFRMVGQFAAGLNSAELRGFVDYRAIPLTIEWEGGREGGMACVAGRIPADPLGGTTTLTFHCPAVPSPNPVDRRRLSFAFVRLEAGEPVAARAAA